MKQAALFFLLATILPFSLFAYSPSDEPVPVKPGIWRGVLTRGGNEIPFNFEIKGEDQSRLTITLLNGAHRDNFLIRRKGEDSLVVELTTAGNTLLAKIETDGTLSGTYKSASAAAASAGTPFRAEFGKSYRFVEPDKAIPSKANLTGKWLIRIKSNRRALPENSAKEVALFTQQGNKLTGAIMTVSGDSGPMEGNVQGNSFMLSTFTGLTMSTFKGNIDNNDTISGILSISANGADTVSYTGIRDAGAELPDAYAITTLKSGTEKFNFTFPDLNGQPVSLSDNRFKGKVVIIDIMGSWCHNCMDEITFLAPWYKANQQRGVEIIGLAFETKDSLAYAKRMLDKVKAKFDIQYLQLFAGTTAQVQDKLPMLHQFAAFPTTIMIDKKGTVREIYAGFTGQATGKYFDDFTAKFNQQVDKLLAEPATP